MELLTTILPFGILVGLTALCFGAVTATAVGLAFFFHRQEPTRTSTLAIYMAGGLVFFGIPTVAPIFFGPEFGIPLYTANTVVYAAGCFLGVLVIPFVIVAALLYEKRFSGA